MGVIFNWAQYLLNELIEEAEKAQEDDKAKLHYSWFLILISFILWSNPPEYQLLDVSMLFLGAKYHNIWDDEDDRIRKKDNNIDFFLHGEGLRNVIR